MRRIAAGVLLLAAMAAGAPSLARADDATRLPLEGIPGYSYVTVSGRPGVTQGFLLMEPKHSRASVILFVGGNGLLGLSDTGFAPNFQGNFLMRTRDLFAAQGLRVALVDTPSDQPSLLGFRTTPEHAQDVAAVIRYLRRHRRHEPVWLVGTSRGTISATGVAAHLDGQRDAPDGIALTSTLLVTTANQSVFDVDLSRITLPVLIAHHEQDACFVTLYADVPLLVGALSNADVAPVRAYTGGGPPSGDPCGAFHFHGFVGIEATVVSDLGHDILRRAHRRFPHDR
jgi:pimeloyl-ACP methyl ester carboxylesterase